MSIMDRRAFLRRSAAAAALATGGGRIFAADDDPLRFVVSGPEAVEDASLWDGEFGGWNFGGGPYLEAGFMGGIYAEHRAASLLRFDLSDIPCARVQSARLRLYKPISFVQTADVKVHIQEAPRTFMHWQGGSSESADERGAVTAEDARRQGAMNAEASGTASPTLSRLFARRGAGQWLEFSLPAALVQRWMDHPESNRGLLLTGAAGKEWGEHVFFHSSEHWDRRGPELVIGGTPGTARQPVGNRKRPVNRRINLPPMDAAFEKWLKDRKRLAQFTFDAQMSREQARLFYWFDTTVRRDFIIKRYQKPLEETFVELEKRVTAKDEAGVRKGLEDVRRILLTWEYIRETRWYTSGPLADVLSPRQLGILFAQSIFGRMEEKADQIGKGRLLRLKQDPKKWRGIWQPLTGEELEAHIRDTQEVTAKKMELTPEQKAVVLPAVAKYERLENDYVGEFRKHYDRTRELIKEGDDGPQMLEAVRQMHLNHELFLYYQSIYDTPRWELFVRHGSPFGLAKWITETRKRSSVEQKNEEKRQSIRAYEESLGAGGD